MISTDALETKTELERKILQGLADQLKGGQMTVDRAREVAKIVLEQLKSTQSLVEIHSQLPQLMQKVSELRPIIEPLYKEFNNKVTGAVKSHLDQLLDQGQVEKAHDVVAKVVT